MQEMKIPDEVLIQIFKHLSHQNLFRNVALVCKRFYNITKDPCFFQELYFKDFDNFELMPAFNVLKNAKKLKRIIIEELPLYTEIILEKALMTKPELMSIEFRIESSRKRRRKDNSVRPYYIHCLTWRSSELMLDYGTNLQYLNLKHVQVDHRQLLNIAKMPKLKQLILGRLADFHSRHLDLMTAHCDMLEDLEFQCFGVITEQSMEAFCQSKKRFTMKRLCIGSINSRQHPIQCPVWSFNSISLLEKLESLEFNNWIYGVDEIKAKKIAKIPNLKRLAFKFDQLYPKYVQSSYLIFNTTIVLSQLLYLMNTNKLEGILLKNFPYIHKFFCKDFALKKYPSLKSLVISTDHEWTIEPSDLKDLVKSCPKLKNLDIKGNDLSLVSDEFLCKIEDTAKFDLNIDRFVRQSLKKYRRTGRSNRKILKNETGYIRRGNVFDKETILMSKS